MGSYATGAKVADEELPATTPGNEIGPAALEFLERSFRSPNTRSDAGQHVGMASSSITVIDILIDRTRLMVRVICMRWCDSRPLPTDAHYYRCRHSLEAASIYQALPKILGFQDVGQLTIGLSGIHLRGIGGVFLTPAGAASKTGQNLAAELRRLGVPVAAEPQAPGSPKDRALYLLDRWRARRAHRIMGIVSR